MRIIGLDFETYSDVNLPKHGLDRYLDTPFFKPLLASWSWRDNDGTIFTNTIDFVVNTDEAAILQLQNAVKNSRIAAHNAPFERQVLAKLGIPLPADRFIDSAVVARVAGAASKLEAAAPQLLGIDKLDIGTSLIKIFSIPGKYQEQAGSNVFIPAIVADRPGDWREFIKYCELDAKLSLQIVDQFLRYCTLEEMANQAVTMDMSWIGWPVDVACVEEMNRRYLENQEQAVSNFRASCNAPDLNLNSTQQMQKWCEVRGVKSKSFDEKNVARMLRAVTKKLEAHVAGTSVLPDSKLQNYREVKDLLDTKQILGGSSLKKLDTILNVVGRNYQDETYRLRDQYLHCGAGQSLRTTGRSVQMQNLKRIGIPGDMGSLFDDETDWSNDELAENIRQCFTASDPNGYLIVGDFSSVESRGLAWLAGEDWKLDAFRRGEGIYEILATKIYNVALDSVDKAQRQVGKVGELSCGYQAGPGAVKDFALNYGVELSEAEAGKLVRDWREANPKIVQFWYDLDDMIRGVLDGTGATNKIELADRMSIMMTPITTPVSLIREAGPRIQSFDVRVYDAGGQIFLRRIFHGAYEAGNSIRYYRPAETKTGKLWRPGYTDPKTKQFKYYSIYGGKMAGILTQSFCRELFFQSLREVHRWTLNHDNVQLIGQFHDEIVLDWQPGGSVHGVDLEGARSNLKVMMSDPGIVKSFPLAAEVKSDYRYTK